LIYITPEDSVRISYKT